MGWLIDTNVAIHFRDGDVEVTDRLAALSSPPEISIVTRVELENGVHAKPERAAIRRAALDSFLPLISIHDFDDAAFQAYARIVANTRYSRSRILDRMIAATAMMLDFTLITMNGDDFRDIPGLKLEIWPAPAQ